ncbi:N(6)-L-threonylcarbamoyladenine synthase [Malassezia yamatoensis]|uniref:N(6)-L-threonylcarbamoyladenine synthase n=1 Tax=Malassezia yamatoensis TaxID=253288 RepID=A0AAJ5YWM3_9BASI|nr:N(6)-L-threonylcarbamoyladenine synthase [Malassezia yamatoensis]
MTDEDGVIDLTSDSPPTRVPVRGIPRSSSEQSYPEPRPRSPRRPHYVRLIDESDEDTDISVTGYSMSSRRRSSSPSLPSIVRVRHAPPAQRIRDGIPPGPYTRLHRTQNSAQSRNNLLERLGLLASRYVARTRNAETPQTLLRPYATSDTSSDSTSRSKPLSTAVLQRGFDPKWTHPHPPPTGFSHHIIEPPIDLEGVLAGDQDAVDPIPNTTPICAGCHAALVLGGEGALRIWALPCGHVIDGRCMTQFGQVHARSSSSPSTGPLSARVFQCPVPQCKQRCHPEPGHRHSCIQISCDDSCASVVTSDRTILSSVVLRQDHAETQGIHPLHAARGHHKNIPLAIKQALDQSNTPYSAIDGIAVTQGPGMPGCLAVGMTAAKTLSTVLGKPLVYVHHMKAHALTPLLTEANPPTFPFLTLLVSGGHTLLVLVHSLHQFQILATTLDDSVGNTFDKFARELGLEWQSAPGALVEALASEATEPFTEKLPHIMLGASSFSYSGLKSAASRAIKKNGTVEHMPRNVKAQLAHAFQTAAFSQLEDKLVRAMCDPSNPPRLAKGWVLSDSAAVDPLSIHSVVVSGGVASNKYLRERLQIALSRYGRSDVRLHFPPLSLCVDNAAMIAWAGHLYWDQRTYDTNPHVIAQWPVG